MQMRRLLQQECTYREVSHQVGFDTCRSLSEIFFTVPAAVDIVDARTLKSCIRV